MKEKRLKKPAIPKHFICCRCCLRQGLRSWWHWDRRRKYELVQNNFRRCDNGGVF